MNENSTLGNAAGTATTAVHKHTLVYSVGAQVSVVVVRTPIILSTLTVGKEDRSATAIR